MKPREKIAIVGMGTVLPGCESIDQFWQLLLSEKDAVTAFSSSESINTNNKGCWVDNLRELTREIPHRPDFMDELDGTFHLALACSWLAIRDSRIKLDRTQTGLILGNVALPTKSSSRLARQFLTKAYQEINPGCWPHLGEKRPHPLNLECHGLPAALVAHTMNLKGIVSTIDAACASSVFAIKLACDQLLSGKCDAMICGGIAYPDRNYVLRGFRALNALSEDGTSRPFDRSANGLVVGEGGGVFVLRTLEKALASGDRIYGTIAGIGISGDTSGSLMSPQRQGQVRAMESAYQYSGWDPSSLDFIECHATGTPLGDATELDSLAEIIKPTGRKTPIAIGSVKGHLGHLLTAAGATSVAKVLLAFRHHRLPGTCHLRNSISEKHSYGHLFATSSQPVSLSSKRPLRAAVNGFGFGGINAHLLLEEWDDSVPPMLTSRTSMTLISQSRDPIAVVGCGRLLPDHSGQWGGDGIYGHPLGTWVKEEVRGEPAESSCCQYLDIPLGAFHIPPIAFPTLLPSQWLLLLAAFQSVNDANLTESELLETGAFVGFGLDGRANYWDWLWHMESSGLAKGELSTYWPDLNSDRTLGALGGISASRIAKELKLGRSGFTVWSGENSGLTAMKFAIDAIRHQKMPTAVVAAADCGGLLETMSYQLLSKDQGRNRVADSAVAFVLQPLSQALTQKRSIYGIVDEIDMEYGESRVFLSEKGLDSGKKSDGQPYFGCAQGMLDWFRSLEMSKDGEHVRSFWSQGFDGSQASVTFRPSAHIVPQVTWPKLNEIHSQKPSVQVKLVSSWPSAPKNIQAPQIRGSKIERQGGSKKKVTTTYIRPRNGLTSQEERRCGILSGQIKELTSYENARLHAHGAFLNWSQTWRESLEKITRYSPLLLAQKNEGKEGENEFREQGIHFEMRQQQGGRTPGISKNRKQKKPVFDYSQCQEFARGKIANVLGLGFGVVDKFSVRTRLPDGPLLLCHRIMSIEGQPKSMSTGSLVSEHDITSESWYLDNGGIPAGIAIEAGQADLFLSAYLGIDFITQGKSVYRLLDAGVTFHDHLPEVGQTIRYEITIEKFFIMNKTYFFRFNFQGFVDKKLLLTMKGGCAGFFTKEQLIWVPFMKELMVITP